MDTQITKDQISNLEEDGKKEVVVIKVKHKGIVHTAVIAADFNRLMKANALALNTSASFQKGDGKKKELEKIDIQFDHVRAGDNLLFFANVKEFTDDSCLKKAIVRGKIARKLGEWVQDLFEDEETEEIEEKKN